MKKENGQGKGERNKWRAKRGFRGKKTKAKKNDEEKTVIGDIFLTRKGVGYLEVSEHEEDAEISPDMLRGAFHGDKVEAKIFKRGKDKMGAEVVRVIERAKKRFVGTLAKEKGRVFLVPDDQRFYLDIEIKDKLDALPNEKALAEITEWRENGHPMGKKGEHNTEMESIMLDKGFATSFSSSVEEAALEVKQKSLPISQEDIRARKDLRDILTFTIDPENAKDFDDAISYRKLNDGLFEIGVHIADVSHYVRPESVLDKEASKRAFSIYLVDRTIPMLPEILSNGICSLNPGEDKLTFSAIFEITENAEITKRWFGKTVIRSDKIFTYEEAQDALNNDKRKYHEELSRLNGIAKILAKRKFAAGALDFETEEIRFNLDPKGRPLGVFKKERLDTHKLVEEFMLLANKEVAEYINRENKKRGVASGAFIYRVHDVPNKDKLADLSIFVKALGYDMESHGGKITSKHIKKLLESMEGKPHESLIKTAAIRSMSKAVYSTRNIGHFGLAFEHYAHFTSPIRRYPDLLAHRVIFSYLNNKPMGRNEAGYFEKMAVLSSEKEIMAAEAERASIKYKQVEYMSDKIGQTFEGIISGVTEWGMYVEEKETKCEGMIRLKDLGDDFYVYNDKTYSVVGQKKKKKFTLGDSVTFKVVAADLERKTLDYKLAL